MAQPPDRIEGPYASLIQPRDFEPFAELVLWHSAELPRDFALMAIASPSVRREDKLRMLAEYDGLSGWQRSELRTTLDDEANELADIVKRHPSQFRAVAYAVADGTLSAAWALGKLAPHGRRVATPMVLKRVVVSACRRGLWELLTRFDDGYLLKAPRIRDVYKYAFRPYVSPEGRGPAHVYAGTVHADRDPD